MCGKCESKLAKASIGLGVVCLLLAVITRLGHFAVANLGSWSFAFGAGLLFLLAIAFNTLPTHEGD